MKFKDLFPLSLKHLTNIQDLNRWTMEEFVEKMRNDNSDVCQELVASGLLTTRQMCHAALHYELGKNREGKTIFWMIDEHHHTRDGMVGDTWASVLLKERGLLDKEYYPLHCLFGLHLLVHTETTEITERPKGQMGKFSRFYTQSVPKALSVISEISVCHKSICIVESVRSCIVLSERFPKYIWMATGYLANLNERLFLPLKGRHIVCFPATDPTGDTYLLWLSTASEARKYGIDITISRFLEDRATPSQKEHCIDLVEFLFETNPPNLP